MRNFLSDLFNKSEAQSNFYSWRSRYHYNKTDYSNNNLWADCGTHPLDNLLIDLTRIYLTASAIDRKAINKHFTKRSHELWQLIIFVRRLGKVIRTEEQTDFVKLGLGASLIDDGRFDFRDSIVSLLILRYAAQKADINISILIDEISEIALSKTMRSILENVKNHSQEDLLYTIKQFGPPEW